MAKALFEVSGTSDSLKPLLSGTRSSSDMRNALGALHQTDFAPVRARAQGYDSLSVFVNPAVVEGFYSGVLNISGVPCTYPSGQSPTTYVPASNNRIDILHVNAAEPNPKLYWVSGTSAASPTIPSISTSGTPICAVYHRAASSKILQTDDATNSYIYRDMRPIYSYSQPYIASASTVLSGSTVQEVYSIISNVVTINSNIPYDDTIPQSSEGVEVITRSITPNNASNILKIVANISIQLVGVNTVGSIALFRNSETDSIAATPSTGGSTGGSLGPSTTAKLIWYVVAGTTSSVTFKIRAGASNTSYVNADTSGNRLFGGFAATTLSVSEIKA